MLQKRLPYDPGAYEIEETYRVRTAGSRKAELRRRAAYEKGRRELDVYYYRVGYTLAFPLPLGEMPAALPQGIPGVPVYPWDTWLAWELRERWYTLHAAWRVLDDAEAGALLQNELAALDGWSTFSSCPPDAGLCTGHLAACLSDFLREPAGWDEALWARARTAGVRMLAQNVAPWYDRVFRGRTEYTPAELANIPCIVLFGSALLSGLLEAPSASELDERARSVLAAWRARRLDREAPYAEGTAYDGFFLDTAVQWVAAQPDREQLSRENREAFCSALDEWLYLSLPGRADLHAPIADAEPEMPFWMNAAAYLTDWYGGDTAWLLRQVPPARLPARLLSFPFRLPARAPADGVRAKALPSAAVLRDGWSDGAVLAAVSCPRVEQHHLHCDGGSLVIGCGGRFFITDPGYQQYREGAERDFTLGPDAHNCPVIGGAAQSRRRAQLLDLSESPERAEVRLRLTDCYEGADGLRDVFRRVVLIPGEQTVVAVCDTARADRERLELSYAWHGGTGLAWAFRDGQARVSDGERALWIAAAGSAVEPPSLSRHPGSRGPLTLRRTVAVTPDAPHVFWVFCFDEGGLYRPPVLKTEGNVLAVELSDGRRLSLDAGI